MKSLNLVNYKSFDQKSFDFSDKINCFVGNNGVGKTNVLDAIYHLAFGRSYLSSISSNNIKHGESFYMIEGVFSQNQTEERIVCSFKKGQKKTIVKDGKAYEKLSEHIGSIPLVIISPSDQDLINEGSETRRQFIDSIACQADRNYLHSIVKYNHVLAQRNALLRFFAANKIFNTINLEIYNEQLSELGTYIYQERHKLIKEFNPILQQRYYEVTQGKEEILIAYESSLHENNLHKLLKNSLERDMAFQYTTQGTHKDDLNFIQDDHSIKKFGSQGQKKSFIIALRLAQFDFIKAKNERTLLLLLDDIFDKLDEHRVSQIINLVNKTDFSQIFLSDTHKERVKNILEEIHKSYEIFEIS